MSTTTSTSTLRKSGLAAAAAAALIAIGVPLALAAPTASPPSDGEGYVDSTARCVKPDTAVIFGTTETSRVAICKTAAGSYQYRGVRVSDGAKLIVAAEQTSTDTFIANNDGVKYTVTPTALSVTANGNTFRTETWTDYHGPQAPASSTSSSAASTSSKPSTSASSTTGTSATSSPSTSGTASAAPTSSAAKSSAAQSSSPVPLPPPLPAEAGGGSSSGE
ncbi:MAG: hypothetical protein ACR2JM_09180 [Mycobacterium sp.]